MLVRDGKRLEEQDVGMGAICQSEFWKFELSGWDVSLGL
jgi:hypothetical protein